MAVRRFFAKKKRKQHEDTWPICQSSCRSPENWIGWPNGKRFAFALTHDVESSIGYDNLDKLLEVEESLGFRSVINFIPEGQYRVDESRIRNLKERGFEVGVHGLVHDGKLFNNRTLFLRRAKRINSYIQEWGVKGFRAPLMHRNLEWLHALHIEYDASTFDTDPFEPQPEGLGTIFPLWIERKIADRSSKIPDRRSLIENQEELETDQESAVRDKRTAISDSALSHSDRVGYLELPYTLPQDSTLFLLLREKTNEIWKRKLDWIAEKGDMSLVNVHPDYIDFMGNGSYNTYPIDHYTEFLEYAKSVYGSQYWHATPGEISDWYRANH